MSKSFDVPTERTTVPLREQLLHPLQRGSDVVADRCLGDFGSVLGHEALVDPLGSVALLERSLAVGNQPAVDQPAHPKVCRYQRIPQRARQDSNQ